MSSFNPIPVQLGSPPRIFDALRNLLRRRVFWVLCDQAIVSAGNFFTANQLARYLPQSEFGSFALLLETMLYANSLQAAVVIYPLTIQAATGEGKGIGRIATLSLILTLALLPIAGIAMALAAAAMTGPSIVLWATLALILWQLQETVRRALMAELRFAAAIPGDFISYCGQAIFIFAAWQMGVLTLNLALIGMSLTSALGIIVQSAQVGLQRVALRDLLPIAREFWVLGRWMLLTNAGGFVSYVSYWWVLRWFYGTAECAIYGAILGVLKLANPIVSGISNLVVPAVAQINAQYGSRGARKTALRYIGVATVILVPYFVALVIAPEFALRLFYGNETPYAQYWQLLRLFVINYTLSVTATFVGAWLLGLGHSRLAFWTQLVNMIVSLLVGLPLTYLLGARGFILGGMVACIAIAVSDLYFLWRVGATNDRPAVRDIPP